MYWLWQSTLRDRKIQLCWEICHAHTHTCAMHMRPVMCVQDARSVKQFITELLTLHMHCVYCYSNADITYKCLRFAALLLTSFNWDFNSSTVLCRSTTSADACSLTSDSQTLVRDVSEALLLSMSASRCWHTHTHTHTHTNWHIIAVSDVSEALLLSMSASRCWHTHTHKLTHHCCQWCQWSTLTLNVCL